MHTFTFNGEIDGVQGVFAVQYGDINELTDLIRQYEVSGVSFGGTPTPSKPKEPICPTHGEVLLTSKRKPNTLFCPHNDGGKYCQYELKQ